MTTLLLIRHGESQANRQGVFAGHFDPDLETKGIKQAQATAQYIKAHYHIDQIYASDLKRAYQTAQSLAQLVGLDIIPNQNLREIFAGKWEGMKFDDLVTTFPEAYGVWLQNIGHAHCPGGESVQQLGDRVMRALTEIAQTHDGQTVAIATHATPIRVAQTIIQTGSLDQMKTIPWVTNASITVLEYANGAWHIAAVSQDAHLDALKTQLPHNV